MACYKTNNLNTSIDVGQINYCYEAHSDEWQKLYIITGRVLSIKILYERFELDEECSLMIKQVDGMLMSTEAVDGAEDDVDGMQASGYIVCLGNTEIRPEKKDEVSFQ